jgi:nucleoside-diphosphate-sugar epimerase
MQNPKKIRWVVTGCNGYLGSEICRTLHSGGNEVVGVSRRKHKNENLLKERIQCITYDDLPDILNPSDCLVHCAGKTGLAGQWEDYEKINVDWSVSLFNLACNYKINCFIYISSVAALGYGNRENKCILNENSTPLLHEQEYYGRSKLLAEKRLQKAAGSADTRLVLLRPGLIYGKRKVDINQKNWLRKGIIVTLRARTPFLYIDNFIDALKKVSINQEAKGVFLVVDDEQPTQKELIHLKKEIGLIKYNPRILSVTGFKAQQILKHFLKKIIRRKNLNTQLVLEPLLRFHSRKIRYDCSRLKKLTNWHPYVTLKEGWQRILEESTKLNNTIP